MDTTATFWLPSASSTVAPEVDGLWHFIYWMSVFFFVMITAGVIYFTVKYGKKRKREASRLDTGPQHNSLLETTWIVIPTILVLIIFVWGFRGYMKMQVAPGDAMEIQVSGQKWFWSFTYPDKLLMSSTDVIHSFYVPAFRIKKDVVPNRYTVAWFEATHSGEFDLFCAEYCGTKHSEMIGKVRVLSNREFNNWLDEAAVSGEGMSLKDYGAKLYQSKACVTCHSLDGTPMNGPSFQGIYGKQETWADGSSGVVDENYIRESILEPNAKVVQGYQPVMPTYQGMLKDREIDALVAFIKAQSEQGREELEQQQEEEAASDTTQVATTEGNAASGEDEQAAGE
jgi:cytochrome c oxidase subunit 2